VLQAAENKARIAGKTNLPDTAKRWKRIADSYPVDEVDAEINAFIKEHFAAENHILQTIPHVGAGTAKWLIAVLHPIDRFDTLWQAKKYVGLNPTQNETGRKKGKPKTSKTGNSNLRGEMYAALFGAAKEKADNRFADVYKKKTALGTPGKKCLQAAVVDMFTVAFYVFKKMEPYHDPKRPIVAAPVLPEHLITQSEYARIIGKSRQAVSQQVKNGKLPTEEWNGTLYIIHTDTPPTGGAAQ
jgi:hypothetical protein